MEDERLFHRLFTHLNGLSPEAQREEVLAYLVAMLGAMSEEEISRLRSHIVSTISPSEERTLLIEVLDGHLAVRRLTNLF